VATRFSLVAPGSETEAIRLKVKKWRYNVKASSPRLLRVLEHSRSDIGGIARRRAFALTATDVGRLIAAIRFWGELGSNLVKPGRRPTSDEVGKHKAASWEPVQTIIEGAREVVKAKRLEFSELLQTSARLLEPFEDPVKLDFEELSGLREEGYSDWLAWIVSQLRSPQQVFRLLGIGPERLVHARSDAKLKVKREESADKKKFGLTRDRLLDLTIRFDDEALILIEVKRVPVNRTSPETRGQLGDEMKWLSQQKAQWTHAIFLVPGFVDQEELPPEPLQGFTPLFWADVCTELRIMLSELRGHYPMTSLGLILGFVGAVEQNILRYPRCDEDKIPENVRVGTWPDLAKHLASATGRHHMGEDNATKSPEKNAGDKLVEAGAFKYVEGMAALADFRNEVQDRCRRVLSSHLPDLSRATAKELSRDDMRALPTNLGAGNVPGFPYLDVELEFISDLWFEVGVCWDYKRQDELRLFAYAGLRFDDETNRYAKAFAALQRQPESGFERYPYDYYITLRDPVPEDDPLSFEKRLDILITKWVNIWGNVGGLAGVLPDLEPKEQSKRALARGSRIQRQ
jgi:hypothetical protein